MPASSSSSRRRHCSSVSPGIEAARRNLRPRGRVVAVVEDEQLLRAVPLARDVREDALPHVLVFSDALYARFAAW